MPLCNLSLPPLSEFHHHYTNLLSVTIDFSLHVLKFCRNTFFWAGGGLVSFTQNNCFEIHSSYTCINTSFIFIVAICHNMFICSPVDRCLGCFQLLVIAFCYEHANRYEHPYPWTYGFTSLRSVLRCGVAGSE